MKVAVTDASIFIDLIHVGWINHLPGIDCEIVTTYEVIAELHEWQQANLREIELTKGLTIYQAPPDELNSWKQRLSVSSGLSRPDLTVLWLATQLVAMVLTGDKLMRTTATRLRLETHGILWLFDQFIENGLVKKDEAYDSLKSLMDFNDRLQEKIVKSAYNYGAKTTKDIAQSNQCP